MHRLPSGYTEETQLPKTEAGDEGPSFSLPSSFSFPAEASYWILLEQTCHERLGDAACRDGLCDGKNGGERGKNGKDQQGQTRAWRGYGEKSVVQSPGISASEGCLIRSATQVREDTHFTGLSLTS